MNDTNWQNLPNTTTPITAERLNKLDKVITAPQTANLNDYTTTGVYYFSAGGTITNVPAGVNGWLIVIDSPGVGAIKQIWLRHGTANTNDFETYVRTLATTWSNWKKIAIDETIAQGTVTFPNPSYFSTIDVNKVYKKGNIVDFRFRGLISTNIPNNTTFLTLPHRTNSDFFKIAYLGTEYTADTPYWVYAQDNRNLRGGSATAGKWLHVSFTYIAES